ncbi:MAG: SCP2 sterol-binding domain-containing protein [Mariprofundaceae bacterium]|nr:SCP2 sterol-binding domain-containing protein [Mariprofundaceae bacterium]
MLKLKVLPQPEVFLQLLPGFLQVQVLESLLGRIFTSDRQTCLQPLSGKLFLFRTPDGEIELFMHVDRQGLHIQARADEAPDVTICGDLLALTALCLGLEDTDTLFFSRRLLLTGDTSTGLMFKNILANLDFDLRAELDQHLGRRAAGTLWRMAAQATGAVAFLDQQLAHAGIAVGEKFGLSSAEKVKALKMELCSLSEEHAALKQQLERRPRPVRSTQAA